ncbi:MAG: mechanosensitive ion channel domain-containing protein [Blastocatellia bacterium]
MEFLTKLLFHPTTTKILIVIIGIIIIAIARRIINKAVVTIAQESDTKYRLQKITAFVGYLATILVIATVFSDQLGGLTVFLGVAGAGIAFALQEVIASFAGWFAIHFAGFFKTGDRVQLGGIRGDVIDISILRTTIMEVGEWVKGDLYNGRVVRVANSFVFKEPVYNYSGDFPFLWDEIILPIKYGSDRKLAREIMEKVTLELVGEFIPKAKESWKNMTKLYLIENASVEPIVTLVANDNWLEYTIRYVVNFKNRRTTKDRLFDSLMDHFDKTDGKVAMASMTVHLVETPTFDVRIKN